MVVQPLQLPERAVAEKSRLTGVEVVEPVGDSRFQFRLQPTLDEAGRRQLVGCLQDLRIDHVLANVVSIDDVATGDDGRER